MPTHSLAEKHLERSAVHAVAAEKLAAVGDDWAAVCYFYAAYRAALAAFQSDARLSSDAGARAVNAKLTATSRHATHHQFHPARGPGVNDIVRYLYPLIGAKYELLHTKSVEVRYLDGMTAGTIADARGLYDDVRAEFAAQGVI